MGRRRQWRRNHEIQKNPNPKRSLILHEELIFLIASTGSCLLVSRFCKFCSVAVSTSHSIRAAFEQNWRNIRAKELEEPSSSIGAVFEQNSRSLSSSIRASEKPRQVLNCLSHDFGVCVEASCDLCFQLKNSEMLKFLGQLFIMVTHSR